MTAQEHQQRHHRLHAALDELVADYLKDQGPTKFLALQGMLSGTSVLELYTWSALQCLEAGPMREDTPILDLDEPGGTPEEEALQEAARQEIAVLFQRPEESHDAE